MNDRTWHKGPPPHVGFWNASTSWSPQVWRWWDGERWSLALSPSFTAEQASIAMDVKTDKPELIEWTHYYPKDARVPRINPEGEK